MKRVWILTSQEPYESVEIHGIVRSKRSARKWVVEAMGRRKRGLSESVDSIAFTSPGIDYRADRMEVTP